MSNRLQPPTGYELSCDSTGAFVLELYGDDGANYAEIPWTAEGVLALPLIAMLAYIQSKMGPEEFVSFLIRMNCVEHGRAELLTVATGLDLQKPGPDVRAIFDKWLELK